MPSVRAHGFILRCRLSRRNISAVALLTPFTCSNTAECPETSAASTTVSEALVLLSGWSAAGFELHRALEAWHAMV